MFAQDSHHVWFATRGYGAPGNVLSLDDGGTPADTGDDHWQTFPIGSVDGEPVVAVDALGRLWHGQGSGLYRYDGSSWRLIYGARPVCDLAPAADGTLYAQVAADQAAGCEEHSDQILVVRADGTINDIPFYSKWLILHEPASVRTAWRRNSLWTLASDGAIWYVTHLDPGQELQRRTNSGLTTYALPVAAGAVRRLEVDARGHVWLVANSQLWRMAGPRPIYGYLPTVSR
jgi:ligand-binding sensor domain-containing protein